MTYLYRHCQMGKVAHGYIFLMILKRVQKVKLNKAYSK